MAKYIFESSPFRILSHYPFFTSKIKLLYKLDYERMVSFAKYFQFSFKRELILWTCIYILDFHFHLFCSIYLLVLFRYYLNYLTVCSLSELFIMQEFVCLPSLRYFLDAIILWPGWYLSKLTLGKVSNNAPNLDFSYRKTFFFWLSEQTLSIIIFFYAKNAAVSPGLAVVFLVKGLN